MEIVNHENSKTAILCITLSVKVQTKIQLQKKRTLVNVAQQTRFVDTHFRFSPTPIGCHLATITSPFWLNNYFYNQVTFFLPILHHYSGYSFTMKCDETMVYFHPPRLPRPATSHFISHKPIIALYAGIMVRSTPRTIGEDPPRGENSFKSIVCRSADAPPAQWSQPFSHSVAPLLAQIV